MLKLVGEGFHKLRATLQERVGNELQRRQIDIGRAVTDKLRKLAIKRGMFSAWHSLDRKPFNLHRRAAVP